MSLLKKVRNINKYDKKLVQGYIRRIQGLISKQQIPLVIDYICLLFFCEMDRYGKKVFESIHQHNPGEPYCSWFGIMDIMHTEYSSNFLYQWRFKYHTAENGGFTNSDIIIGITNSSHAHWFNSRCGHHIGLTNGGILYKTVYRSSKINKSELYLQDVKLASHAFGKRWMCNNDEIIMTVDVKKKLMKYVIKRTDGKKEYWWWNIPISFQGKDHKYRMAVAYCYYLASVELIEFNKIVATS